MIGDASRLRWVKFGSVRRIKAGALTDRARHVQKSAKANAAAAHRRAV
jgi:hypothetical protein